MGIISNELRAVCVRTQKWLLVLIAVLLVGF
jgi:hypothetical protein